MKHYALTEKKLEGMKKEEIIKDYYIIPKKMIDESCIVVWQKEDIIEKANDMGVKLTEDEAIDILSELHRRHDCTCGITWDTIEYTIDYYKNQE